MIKNNAGQPVKPLVIFNWSGGKDSALCLHRILRSGDYDVLCLLTTISETYQRISMHGVRTALLERQAESVGLPLVKVSIPEMPTMEMYDNVMATELAKLQGMGAMASVFGDIFLEDLRKYREEKLSESGLKGIFPLWKLPTRELVMEFINLGFKAVITCVNDRYLDSSFAGRIIDRDFLKDLPPTVDPCGENGEFHSFVFDGPIFSRPVEFEKGEVVYRKYEPSPPANSPGDEDPANDPDHSPFTGGFWYCDLIPVNAGNNPGCESGPDN